MSRKISPNQLILEGPSIKDLTHSSLTPASLVIAQLLRYNSVMHIRKHTGMVTSVRHNINQETPLPTYIGLMLHATLVRESLLIGCISLDLVFPMIECFFSPPNWEMEYVSALKGKRWSVQQSFVEKYLHLLQLTILTTIPLQQLLRIHFIELRSPCSSILVLLGKVLTVV